MITVSELSKRFGKLDVLKSVNAHFEPGKSYAMVGPNGSGKTTALEILAGLRRPTSGTIELGVAREDLAYCPDVGEFEPWLSAGEVLASAAGLVGRPQSAPAIAGMLDRVGLADAGNRHVGGFSRGMRSRLGLAAGLIGQPKLLIADEPAAALDPAGDCRDAKYERLGSGRWADVRHRYKFFEKALLDLSQEAN